MTISSRVLKTLILFDENFHFTPSAQQIDYLFAWFPEIFSNGEKSLKKNWRMMLYGKHLTKNQYLKLQETKLKTIEDSKLSLTKLNWKRVETAIKECEIETGHTPEHIHHAFLRKVFSLIGAKIIDVSIDENSNTSVMFDYYGKILQAECVEVVGDIPGEIPHLETYLWTSINEKIDCTGSDIKEAIEKYIANGEFTKIKSRSLKIGMKHLNTIQKKWRPRFMRIENIYTGKSGRTIQPAIVLVNQKKEPIAIMTPGDDCDACLERSKEYAEEVGVNYAFSTNLEIYKLHDFVKNKDVEGAFEELPPHEWIQNWDQTVKKKAAKQNAPKKKQKFDPTEMEIADLLIKLEEKNKRRAEHGLPPLNLMEYLKTKGITTLEMGIDLPSTKINKD